MFSRVISESDCLRADQSSGQAMAVAITLQNLTEGTGSSLGFRLDWIDKGHLKSEELLLALAVTSRCPCCRRAALSATTKAFWDMFPPFQLGPSY